MSSFNYFTTFSSDYNTALINVPPGECIVLQIQSHVLTELTCFRYNEDIKPRKGHTLIRIDKFYSHPFFDYHHDVPPNIQSEDFQKELLLFGDSFQFHYFHGRILTYYKFWHFRRATWRRKNTSRNFASILVEPSESPIKMAFVLIETPHRSRSLSHQSIVLKSKRSKPQWLSSSFSWLESTWYHLDCEHLQNEQGSKLFSKRLMEIACNESLTFLLVTPSPYQLKMSSVSFVKPNLCQLKFWLKNSSFPTGSKIGKLTAVSDPREFFCQGLFSSSIDHACIKHTTEHNIFEYHFRDKKSYQFHVLFYENAEIVFHPILSLPGADLRFTWNEITFDRTQDLADHRLFTSDVLISWIKAHKICKEHDLVMPHFQNHHHLKTATQYLLHKLKIIPSAVFVNIIKKVKCLIFHWGT